MNHNDNRKRNAADIAANDYKRVKIEVNLKISSFEVKLTKNI